MGVALVRCNHDCRHHRDAGLGVDVRFFGLFFAVAALGMLCFPLFDGFGEHFDFIWTRSDASTVTVCIYGLFLIGYVLGRFDGIN